MKALNLPTYSFIIKSEGRRKSIFDIIRKKYVTLTPEEWVRQNFVRYLNEVKGYPLSLMALETAFDLYKTKKRSDILIYNRDGKPVAIVECKAPSVKIDRGVFDQILRYNLKYQLEYMMVTNGISHYFYHMDPSSQRGMFLEEIPTFEQINAS